MSAPRNCSFSAALSYLKAGLRVTRSGWNGKGAWLTLVARNALGMSRGGQA